MPNRPLSRVCYVDDELDIQRVLRMSLERLGGMTVELVNDPQIAIEAMIRFKPDIVLLDWMMPVLDGPALFRKMKEREETKHLPVVFITASAVETQLNQLRDLGAAGVLTKPFSPVELPRKLRSIWEAIPNK